MNLNNTKFIIASGPVIIENGKVLLNRHGHPEESFDKIYPEQGRGTRDLRELRFWKFPGGRIENFDFANQLNSLEEACKREVKEEMGLEIEIIRPLKPMMIKHPDKPNTVVILIHYQAKRLNDIKPANFIEEYAWFNINNLPKNCAPNIKIVIDEYITDRTKKYE
ncbi:MAG: hypothetical protein ACD_58C00218G0001 [uncultured bacterium]|nr:MAG: hypothetical protein ACD_58C00218G0001 [uncultured bacterium]